MVLIQDALQLPSSVDKAPHSYSIADCWGETEGETLEEKRCSETWTPETGRNGEWDHAMTG